jgi:hypothetical protein
MKTCHLVVIPTSLQKVDGMDEAENWMLYWKPTTTATMMQEIRAHNALRRERFVRGNVLLKTFLAWKLENPRSFITERAMRRLTSRAVPDLGE